MTIEDVKYLKLPAEWMRQKYKEAFEFREDPAWMMEHEGRIICAFGAANLWGGVYEIWFNLIRIERPIQMIRVIRRHLAEYAGVYKADRLQSIVKCDFEQARKFTEFFGFKLEGVLKMYNPDRTDAYMYSKIYETPQIEF